MESLALLTLSYIKTFIKAVIHCQKDKHNSKKPTLYLTHFSPLIQFSIKPDQYTEAGFCFE